MGKTRGTRAGKKTSRNNTHRARTVWAEAERSEKRGNVSQAELNLLAAQGGLRPTYDLINPAGTPQVFSSPRVSAMNFNFC